MTKQAETETVCDHCGKPGAVPKPHHLHVMDARACGHEFTPRTQTQGELRIPDDLQELYVYMSMPAASQVEHNMQAEIVRLVERIARQEGSR